MLRAAGDKDIRLTSADKFLKGAYSKSRDYRQLQQYNYLLIQAKEKLLKHDRATNTEAWVWHKRDGTDALKLRTGEVHMIRITKEEKIS